MPGIVEAELQTSWSSLGNCKWVTRSKLGLVSEHYWIKLCAPGHLVDIA